MKSYHKNPKFNSKTLMIGRAHLVKQKWPGRCMASEKEEGHSHISNLDERAIQT